MTNQQVAEAFAGGELKGKSLNMFIEISNNMPVVYSYGYHYPIAIIMSDYIAYVNDDKYSSTTTMHRGRVIRALQLNGFTIEHKTTEELKNIIYNGVRL